MQTGVQNYDVIILGAGITGLVCAQQLARSGRKVLLVDRNNRVGGVIQTVRENGFLLEIGPNSFSPPAEGHELLNDSALRERTLSQPMRDHDRYVWSAGSLIKVPVSPGEFVRSSIMPPADKARLALAVWKQSNPVAGDLSIGSYFRTHLGDAAVEILLKPMVTGIFAADADQVSLEAGFPRVYAAAKQHRSLLRVIKHLKSGAPRTPKALVSFDDGMGVLVQHLATSFSNAGGETALNEEIGPLPPQKGGEFIIELSDRQVNARHVVIALPAYAAATAMQRLTDSSSASALQALQDVDYAPMTIVHIGVCENQLKEHRSGFGFLARRNQGLRALGMIWSDRIFSNRAPAGHRLLTCFYGGSIDPSISTYTDSQLVAEVRADLKRAMGFDGGAFALFKVTQWKRALPVLRVGHAERMRQVIAALPPGISLTGNYCNGVAIADCLRASTMLAAKLSAFDH